MLDLFKAATQCGVPIVVIRTADQEATIQTISQAFSKPTAAEDYPLVQWDAARGLTAVPSETQKPYETPGGKALRQVDPKGEMNTVDWVAAMLVAAKLPAKSIVFARNAHRQLVSSEPLATAQSIQVVSNLRDEFKRNFRILVLLGPGFAIPPELDQDVVVIDHALPGPAELRQIIVSMYESASAHADFELPKPSEETLDKAVAAIRGLNNFAAEQVTAMSMRETGVDLDAMWERTRVTIEQTRGLRVWRGKEKFSDLIGLESIKAKLTKAARGKKPIGVVVFIDEIDKALANVEQDTTGVRMDQMRTLLTEMENNEWTGVVAVGVAGGGKSAIAKAFGNEVGVPTIALDLGDMEGPHVGESEAMLRHAVAVIKAVGGGNAYVISTSNNASVMRPELQRRFTDGMFFFDLMSQEERAATWAFYMKKYELPAQPLPPDDAWTGAEIRNCCRSAWNTDDTLEEAAKFIVPMAQSRGDDIELLRRYAHGRFLDANRPGTFRHDGEPMSKVTRAIELPPAVAQVLTGMKES